MSKAAKLPRRFNRFVKHDGTTYSKHSSACDKFCKQQAARLRRRAEKLDPENAPKHCIAGYAD